MTKWLIPSNPKMFDAISAFKELGSVDWKQSIKVEVGDTIYIYVAAPIKAIRLKCKVTEVNLSDIGIDDSKYVLDGSNFENHGKYMRLELLDSYDRDELSYVQLTMHGLKSVQGPIKLMGELETYVESVNSNDNSLLELGDITDNVLLIKINKSYRADMTPLELYDVTRGCWKRKIDSVSKAEFALSVSESIIREVYVIDSWQPSHLVKRETRENDPKKEKDRITFTGRVAEDEIRKKYIGKNVKNLYKWGEADPLKLILGNTKESNFDSINIPEKPLAIIEGSNGEKAVCPNCKMKFKKAMRCPECGQRILYSE